MRKDLSLLGETAVYPGHPVVISFLIMHEYPNYATATAKAEPSAFCDALSNTNIPGAGGEVSSALHLLKMVIEGHPVEDVVQMFETNWQRGLAGGHPQNVVPGQLQADRIKPEFLLKITGWVKE